MPRSKKYQEAKAKVDSKKVYTALEAIKLVKETSTAKFDASVEIHIRLGIDPAKSDQIVRGTVTLPHGTGKTKRVAAFVGNDKEAEAKAAGADIIGNEEVIEKLVQTGKIDFDVAIATPDMMPRLAKVAKILGPRGLMPNPKTETVGTNVKKMVEDMKGGKIAFKNDDTANVHQIIGKVSFDENKLLENLQTLVDAITRIKPSSSKGIYLQGMSLSSSMGPGIKFQM